MAAMTFEQGLQAQLDADPTLARSLNGKRIARVLALPPKRRQRVLDRMEGHARAHIQFTGKDWSNVKAIDWQSLIKMFETLLPIILELLKLFAVISLLVLFGL